MCCKVSHLSRATEHIDSIPDNLKDNYTLISGPMKNDLTLILGHKFLLLVILWLHFLWLHLVIQLMLCPVMWSAYTLDLFE